MKKFYRVKESNFLWEKNAIIAKGDNDRGYMPISDLWSTTDRDENEYISAAIIEAPENARYFERVYEMSVAKKTMYMVKEKAQKEASRFFEGKE